jgi:glycosyltransferase involved in cell wall biosynthesis
MSVAETPVRVAGSRDEFDFERLPLSSDRSSWNAARTSADAAPLVTVITPVKDSEYLEETAKTLLAQTTQAFRWILVNDGAEADALTALAARDSRVSIVECRAEEGFCGPSKARNTGLAAMEETPFVMFLDSDDLLEEVYIEQLVWMLEGNHEFDYANTYTASFGEKEYLWATNFQESSLTENLQPVTAVIRTSALKKATSFPNSFDAAITGGGEDWKLWLALKDAGLNGVTIPEYMFWQRSKAHRENWNFLSRDKSTSGFDAAAAKEAFPALFKKGYTNPVLTADGAAPIRSDFMLDKFANVNCKRSIILVIPWMALGGTDTINVKLVQLLTAQNWQVTIVNTLDTAAEHTASPDLEFSRPDLQKYTEDIHVLPHFLRTENYGEFLLHLTKSRGADVIMTSNSFVGYNLLPFLKANAPHVALVDYVHMRQLQTNLPAYYETAAESQVGGFPKLSAQFAQYLDASMYVSNDELQWVANKQQEYSNTAHPENPYFNPALKSAAHGTPERFVVYNGLDTEEQFAVPDEDTKQEVRAKYGIADDEMVIAFVGRIVEQKRPLVALQVLRRMLTDSTPAHLLVVGGGHLQPEMYRFVADNGLWAHVTFLGNVKRTEIASALACADAMIMPSEMEGLAVSLIEAMAMGVVPVVTNVGGQKEVVVKDAGFLTAVDDVEAMTDALTKLAQNPELMATMSANARKSVVSKFTDSKMSASVAEAFDAAIVHAQATKDLATPQIAAQATSEIPRIANYLRDVDGSLGSFQHRFNDMSASPEDGHLRRTGASGTTSGTASGTASGTTDGPTGLVISFGMTVGGLASTDFDEPVTWAFRIAVAGLSDILTCVQNSAACAVQNFVASRRTSSSAVTFDVYSGSNDESISNTLATEVAEKFTDGTFQSGFNSQLTAAGSTLSCTGITGITYAVAGSSSSSSSSSSSLSGGAIAGIVIACAVGLLIIIGLVYYFLFGGKSKHTPTDNSVIVKDPSGNEHIEGNKEANNAVIDDRTVQL